MLIARCAWHPRYFGRPRILRVLELCGSGGQGGAGIYTDGMCADCLARLEAEIDARRPAAAATR